MRSFPSSFSPGAIFVVRPALPLRPSPRLLPRALTMGLALIVFSLDTFTKLDIAIAVLYVAVILLAADFCAARGILLVGAGCACLTLFSFLLTHSPIYAPGAVARCGVSLAAIAITTLLVWRAQATMLILREQAQLLDLTHDSVVVRGSGDHICYWNQGAEDLYGWSRAEALGRITHELLQTEFPEPPTEIMARLRSVGIWEGELSHVARDGRRILVASRWSLQGHGRIATVLETSIDITGRREAEERVRRAEAELRMAIETIPAIVWFASPEGEVSLFGGRWRAFGPASGDLGAGAWRSLVHPDDLLLLEDSWQTARMRSTEFEALARLQSAAGRYRHYLIRGAPLRDADGAILRWYGVIFDTEGRKQAEDAVRRSESSLAQAQRLSRTGSFRWTIGTDALLWSAEMYRIHGIAPGTPVTMDAALMQVHRDDMRQLRVRLRHLAEAEEGATVDLQFRLLPPGGGPTIVRMLAEAIGVGATREVIGAELDITETVRAQDALLEAQAQLAHAGRVAVLGELTASIAHEVNQPLAAIVTNGSASLRWLRRAEPDLGEVASGLERIVQDGRRAADVIDRLRALARREEARREPINLNEAVEDAVRLLGAELRGQGVALRLELAPLPRVLGDRVQLQQVVINLLMNAIQAMAKTPDAARELVVHSLCDDPAQVTVRVQDSGGGIDPQVAEKVFDAFYSTKPKGMGIGLSLCRSIIGAHGGRIWAEPNPGRGATFQFALPVTCEASA